jgi:SAM-dependent methyltransferase
LILSGRRRRASLHQDVFSRIYSAREWGDSESLSGPGSGLARTRGLREALPGLLRELDVGRLLDAGCGDFYWLRIAELPVREYVGVDVVPDLISRLVDMYSRPGRWFVHADITRDRLPLADFVLCREVLMHFPDEDVLAAITNMKRSRARWLLTTTFVERTANEVIELGAWRPLNLEAPPFNFPTPLRMFEDIPLVDYERFRDKRLALWELSTLL